MSSDATPHPPSSSPSAAPGTALRAAAAAVAGVQQYPAGALYVVATPIGNRADLTLRAIHLLGLVDAVACEDTRVSAGLLGWLGLDKPLLSLHAHNEREAAARVIARLGRGERVAQVSDAGTPGVSDPGARLVAAVREAGHAVVVVPGASSVAAAISVAGDVGGGSAASAFDSGFRFAGFVPSRGREREAFLAALAAAVQSTVLFESPHRIAALAGELAARMPQRRLTVCRELTKQHEQIHALAAADWPAWLAADADRARGEFVVVAHALPARDDDLLARAGPTLRTLLGALPLKQAVALAAELTGAPRNALYPQALAWRQAAGPGDGEGEGEGSRPGEGGDEAAGGARPR